MTEQRRGILSLPPLGARGSPPEFVGAGDDSVVWFERYETLADFHGLSGEDKCKGMLLYWSPETANFLRLLQPFKDKNWEDLKAEILEFFPSPLRDLRYTSQDLLNLSNEYREKPMTNIMELQGYVRKFFAVGLWLRQENRIDDATFNLRFWTGFPDSVRKEMEIILRAKLKEQFDITKPFDSKEVHTAAKTIFNHKAFDAEVRFGDSVGKAKEIERKQRKKTLGQKYVLEQTQKNLQNNASTELAAELLELEKEAKREEGTSKPAVASTIPKRDPTIDRELEDLIREMKDMDISDPKYASNYNRAMIIAPDAAATMTKPNLGFGRRQRNQGAYGQPSFQSQTGPSSFIGKGSPPHFDQTGGAWKANQGGFVAGGPGFGGAGRGGFGGQQSAPQQQGGYAPPSQRAPLPSQTQAFQQQLPTTRQPSTPPADNSSVPCSFCASPGHSPAVCPQLGPYLADRTLRVERGRVLWSNGNPVQLSSRDRSQKTTVDESLAQQKGATGLIRVLYNVEENLWENEEEEEREEIRTQSRDKGNRDFSRRVAETATVEIDYVPAEPVDPDEEEDPYEDAEEERRAEEEESDEMTKEEEETRESEEEEEGQFDGSTDTDEEETEEEADDPEGDEEEDEQFEVVSFERANYFEVRDEPETTDEATFEFNYGESTFEIESDEERGWVRGFHAGMGVANAERQQASRPSQNKPYERTSRSPEPTGRRAISDLMNPDSSNKQNVAKKAQDPPRDKGKGKEVEREAPKDVEMEEEGREKTKRSTTRANTTEFQKSTDVDKVLEKIANAPIELTVRELAAVSKIASDFLAKQTKTFRDERPVEEKKKVAHVRFSDDEEEGEVAFAHEVQAVPENKKVLFSCGLDRMPGNVAGKEVMLMIDTGSEINVMGQRVQEKLGLPLNPNSNMTMVTANNTKEKMVGVCEDVVIKVGGLETAAHIHVTRNPGNFAILLGQPWIDRVRGEIYWVDDKKWFRWRTPAGVRQVRLTPDHDPKRREDLPDSRIDATNTIRVEFDEGTIGQEGPGPSTTRLRRGRARGKAPEGREEEEESQPIPFASVDELPEMGRRSREERSTDPGNVSRNEPAVAYLNQKLWNLTHDEEGKEVEYVSPFHRDAPESPPEEDEGEDPPQYQEESDVEGKIDPFLNLNQAMVALTLEEGKPKKTLRAYAATDVDVWMDGILIVSKLKDSGSNINLFSTPVYLKLLALGGSLPQQKHNFCDTSKFRMVSVEIRVNGSNRPTFICGYTGDEVRSPVVLGHPFWYEAARHGDRPTEIELVGIETTWKGPPVKLWNPLGIEEDRRRTRRVERRAERAEEEAGRRRNGGRDVNGVSVVGEETRDARTLPDHLNRLTRTPTQARGSSSLPVPPRTIPQAHRPGTDSLSDVDLGRLILPSTENELRSENLRVHALVDHLITRMFELGPNDPEYATSFSRIMSLSPLAAASMIRPPSRRGGASQPRGIEGSRVGRPNPMEEEERSEPLETTRRILAGLERGGDRVEGRVDAGAGTEASVTEELESRLEEGIESVKGCVVGMYEVEMEEESGEELDDFGIPVSWNDEYDEETSSGQVAASATNDGRSQPSIGVEKGRSGNERLEKTGREEVLVEGGWADADDESSASKKKPEPPTDERETGVGDETMEGFEEGKKEEVSPGIEARPNTPDFDFMPPLIAFEEIEQASEADLALDIELTVEVIRLRILQSNNWSDMSLHFDLMNLQNIETGAFRLLFPPKASLARARRGKIDNPSPRVEAEQRIENWRSEVARAERGRGVSLGNEDVLEIRDVDSPEAVEEEPRPLTVEEELMRDVRRTLSVLNGRLGSGGDASHPSVVRDLINRHHIESGMFLFYFTPEDYLEQARAEGEEEGPFEDSGVEGDGDERRAEKGENEIGVSFSWVARYEDYDGFAVEPYQPWNGTARINQKELEMEAERTLGIVRARIKENRDWADPNLVYDLDSFENIATGAFRKLYPPADYLARARRGRIERGSGEEEGAKTGNGGISSRKYKRRARRGRLYLDQEQSMGKLRSDVETTRDLLRRRIKESTDASDPVRIRDQVNLRNIDNDSFRQFGKPYQFLSLARQRHTYRDSEDERRADRRSRTERVPSPAEEEGDSEIGEDWAGEMDWETWPKKGGKRGKGCKRRDWDKYPVKEERRKSKRRKAGERTHPIPDEELDDFQAGSMKKPRPRAQPGKREKSRGGAGGQTSDNDDSDDGDEGGGRNEPLGTPPVEKNELDRAKNREEAMGEGSLRGRRKTRGESVDKEMKNDGGGREGEIEEPELTIRPPNHLDELGLHDSADPKRKRRPIQARRSRERNGGLKAEGREDGRKEEGGEEEGTGLALFYAVCGDEGGSEEYLEVGRGGVMRDEGSWEEKEENLGEEGGWWPLKEEQAWETKLNSLSFGVDADSSTLYKTVDKKIRPVSTTLPPGTQPRMVRPENLLEDLPEVPKHPGPLRFGERLTAERVEEIKKTIDPSCSEEEIRLVFHILLANEKALAWTDEEKGRFDENLIPPYRNPLVEHPVWSDRPIPIPAAALPKVVDLLREKVKAGVYERSQASYRSRFFLVVKKVAGAMRIVHDLQRLNSYTIRDAGLPPSIEAFVEGFGSRACLSVLDLMDGYGQKALAEESRDPTTFASPIGLLRLKTLPQGATNSVAEFQRTVSFILEDELPDPVDIFVDDVGIKGGTTKYEDPVTGEPETLLENPRIRRYIYEHLLNLNRVLHKMKRYNGTFSGKKLLPLAKEATIVGYRCSYEGRRIAETALGKIETWPTPKDRTDVRGFMGTVTQARSWIKDFGIITSPLRRLLKKEVDFEWGEKEQAAMDRIKREISDSDFLITLDYTSEKPVILAVDTSFRAVGFSLAQEDASGKKRIARYGSILLNERESRYSQAKLELYGLFRALRKTHLYLYGRPFLVETDASYLQGMLRQPETPNAAMTRWLWAIKLYDFQLIHVPAAKHVAVDGLSRRKRAPEDEEEEDAEEWLDEMVGFVGSEREKEQERRRFGEVKSLKEELYEEEEGWLELGRYLESLKFPDGLNNDEKNKLHRRAKAFFLADGRIWKRGDGMPREVVLGKERKRSILARLHDALGHKGMRTTYRRVADRFYWRGMMEEVSEYVKTCDDCQHRDLRRYTEPIKPTFPTTIFSKISIDLIAMPQVGQFSLIVIARDDLSGWVEAEAITNKKAATITKFFWECIISRGVIPGQVTSDLGGEFEREFKELLREYGIPHIQCSAYHPQANGSLERGNLPFKEAIFRSCRGNIQRWPRLVRFAAWADRTSTRESTGFTPYRLVFGVEAVLPIDWEEATWLVRGWEKVETRGEMLALRMRQLERREEDVELAVERKKLARTKSADNHNQKYHHRHSKLLKEPVQVGDLVLVRNSSLDFQHSRKEEDLYLGPYRVLGRTESGAYRIAEVDGTKIKSSIAAIRIRPYYQRTDVDIDLLEQASEPLRPRRRDELEEEAQEVPPDPVEAFKEVETRRMTRGDRRREKEREERESEKRDGEEKRKEKAQRRKEKEADERMEDLDDDPDVWVEVPSIEEVRRRWRTENGKTKSAKGGGTSDPKKDATPTPRQAEDDPDVWVEVPTIEEVEEQRRQEARRKLGPRDDDAKGRDANARPEPGNDEDEGIEREQDRDEAVISPDIRRRESRFPKYRSYAEKRRTGGETTEEVAATERDAVLEGKAGMDFERKRTKREGLRRR